MTTGTDVKNFLRRKTPIDYSRGSPSLRIVDLFCGCGGMSLGLAEAARRLDLGTDILLAIDTDEIAVGVYSRNFTRARVECSDVREFFDGSLEARLTSRERRQRQSLGDIDVLLGGPPCQGHSNLNNSTRRIDKRNGLYSRMARAARVLRPSIVLIENVPSVLNDHEQIVDVTAAELERTGYAVEHRCVDLCRIGIPQTRKRHFLLASQSLAVDPVAVFDILVSKDLKRTVSWALGDLVETKTNTIFDSTTSTSKENQRRIDWLFDNDEYDLPNQLRPRCHRDKDHTYKSVYGRMKWNQPAQTITTGFLSMGQGRYVHPILRRTITPHEAARLQTFPDFFSFGENTLRTYMARLIGNAVPPLATLAVGEILLPMLLEPVGTSSKV